MPALPYIAFENPIAISSYSILEDKDAAPTGDKHKRELDNPLDSS